MGDSPVLAMQRRELAEGTMGMSPERGRGTGERHHMDSLGRGIVARTPKIPNMGLVPKGGQIPTNEGGSVTTPSRRRVIPQGTIWGALGLRTPWIWRVIPQGSIEGTLGLPTVSSAMPPHPPIVPSRDTWADSLRYSLVTGVTPGQDIPLNME